MSDLNDNPAVEYFMNWVREGYNESSRRRTEGASSLIFSPDQLRNQKAWVGGPSNVEVVRPEVLRKKDLIVVGGKSSEDQVAVIRITSIEVDHDDDTAFDGGEFSGVYATEFTLGYYLVSSMHDYLEDEGEIVINGSSQVLLIKNLRKVSPELMESKKRSVEGLNPVRGILGRKFAQGMKKGFDNYFDSVRRNKVKASDVSTRESRLIIKKIDPKEGSELFGIKFAKEMAKRGWHAESATRGDYNDVEVIYIHPVYDSKENYISVQYTPNKRSFFMASVYVEGLEVEYRNSDSWSIPLDGRDAVEIINFFYEEYENHYGEGVDNYFDSVKGRREAVRDSNVNENTAPMDPLHYRGDGIMDEPRTVKLFKRKGFILTDVDDTDREERYCYTDKRNKDNFIEFTVLNNRVINILYYYKGGEFYEDPRVDKRNSLGIMDEQEVSKIIEDYYMYMWSDYRESVHNESIHELPQDFVRGVSLVDEPEVRKNMKKAGFTLTNVLDGVGSVEYYDYVFGNDPRYVLKFSVHVKKGRSPKVIKVEFFYPKMPPYKLDRVNFRSPLYNIDRKEAERLAEEFTMYEHEDYRESRTLRSKGQLNEETTFSESGVARLPRNVVDEFKRLGCKQVDLSSSGLRHPFTDSPYHLTNWPSIGFYRKEYDEYVVLLEVGNYYKVFYYDGDGEFEVEGASIRKKNLSATIVSRILAQRYNSLGMEEGLNYFKDRDSSSMEGKPDKWMDRQGYRLASRGIIRGRLISNYKKLGRKEPFYENPGVEIEIVETPKGIVVVQILDDEGVVLWGMPQISDEKPTTFNGHEFKGVIDKADNYARRYGSYEEAVNPYSKKDYAESYVKGLSSKYR